MGPDGRSADASNMGGVFMSISKGNRYAVDKGFGWDLYDHGRYMYSVATLSEAEYFVDGGNE